MTCEKEIDGEKRDKLILVSYGCVCVCVCVPGCVCLCLCLCLCVRVSFLSLPIKAKQALRAYTIFGAYYWSLKHYFTHDAYYIYNIKSTGPPSNTCKNGISKCSLTQTLTWAQSHFYFYPYPSFSSAPQKELQGVVVEIFHVKWESLSGPCYVSSRHRLRRDAISLLPDNFESHNLLQIYDL